MNNQNSASYRSHEVWCYRWAFLVHIWVNLNWIETWKFHPILSKDLAVWGIRVSQLTPLRSCVPVLFIEYLDLVHIFWAEFSSVDSMISKESCCFPKGGNVSATHKWFTIMVLSMVFPTILLHHRHYISQGHISFIRFHTNTREIEVFGSKMMIKCLIKENVSHIFVYLLNNRENWTN